MRSNALFTWPARLRIILLFCFISLPAVIGSIGSLRDDGAGPQLENRRMAALPDFALFRDHPADYIQAVDDYLKDHVGFRRQANQLYRKLRYYLLKDPPLPNITIGRDGFIFMNSHRIDQPNFVFNLLCEQQVGPSVKLIEEMDRIFASVSGYYTGRGYPVTIAAAPTNVALYADKLPRSVERKYRDACWAYPASDHLLAQLYRLGRSGGRYNLYYPLPLFQQHRDEPLFWPKELFHWSGRSVYLFARDLLVQSGVVARVSLDDPAEIATVGDDLSMFFGFSRKVKAWKYPYVPCPSLMTKPDWTRALLKRGGLLQYSTTNSLTTKRGLLMANSFGIDLAPHLAKGFSELFFLNLNQVRLEEEELLFSRIVDLTKPDHIYILFDDAGIIAAPDRLKAFLKLRDRQVQGLNPSSAIGAGPGDPSPSVQ